MTRTTWLIFAFFLTFFAIDGSAAVQAAERPNIVVIISDDSGYNEFSLNGSEHFATPRIDSIARAGPLIIPLAAMRICVW